jgi:hypothetical protein
MHKFEAVPPGVYVYKRKVYVQPAPIEEIEHYDHIHNNLLNLLT